MAYGIRVVDNEALPAEQEWAMVEVDGATILAVKESALRPQALAEAWGAYRLLDRQHTPCRRRLRLA